MNCEDIGTLRAYLDDELAGRDGQRVRLHLEGCATCRAKLEKVRLTATLANETIGALESPLVLDQASRADVLARIRTGLEARGSSANANRAGNSDHVSGRFSMITNGFVFRYRIALAGIAAVLVLGLIGLTPQGQAAAANFLAQFRAQKLQPVTVDPQEFAQAMKELAHFGDIDASRANRTFSHASSVAEAAQQAGLSIKQPQNLPSGIPPEPNAIRVSAPQTVSFTFRVAKAQSYLSSIGQSSFAIPAKFDGVTLTAHVPAAVLMSYGQNNTPATTETGKPTAPAAVASATALASSLIVAEAGVPSADINGNVSAAELHDLLLHLPGLSASTVTQLQAIDDWTNTLPVPLPKDKSTWHQVDLGGGVTALVVGDNTGMGGFVIWQQNGMIYGVGGPFAQDQLLAVARSLR